eukprot:145998_1
MMATKSEIEGSLLEDEKKEIVQCGFADEMLHRLLKTDTSKNFILSPYSLLSALTICMNGSRKNTLKQFNNVLYPSQLSATPQNAQKYYENMCKINIEYMKNEDDNIMTANAIWVNNKWKLLDIYTESMDEKVITMDFSSPKTVANVINDWVSKKTMRRITEILNPGHIDPLRTPMIITNAIYFKSTFEIPFKEQFTKENQPFYYNSSRWMKISKKCTIMHVGHPFYYEYCKIDNAFNCIKLRYKSKYISLILVQSISRNAHKYFKCKTLKKMTELFKRTLVDLYVPKFKDEYKFEVNEVLQSMGLRDAFNEKKADFSGMIENAKDFNVHVKYVLHKAMIEVDEKGTIAAAATAVIMGGDCGCGGDTTPDYITVKYDYPFQYFIYDERNDNILFAGKVNAL